MLRQHVIIRNTITLTVFLIVLLSVNMTAKADKKPIVIGEYRTLYSEILKEERRVWINLPANYNLSELKYPVLYKCDAMSVHGFASKIHTLNKHDMKRSVPQMIFIEIENTDRQRDMFPARYRTIKPGAEKFLKFIEKELIPFINRNYRTSDYTLLMGESNSALFTVYSFLKKPELFNAYIASSPELGHSMKYLTDLAESSFRKFNYSKKHLYMIYGERDNKNVVKSVPQFTALLKQFKAKGLKWHREVAINEGHVPASGFEKALRFIFKAYLPSDEIIKRGPDSIKVYETEFNETMGHKFNSNTYPQYKYATLLLREKKYKETLELLNNIMKKDPSTAYGLGISMLQTRILQRQKRYSEAIKALEQAKLYSPPMAEFINVKIEKLKRRLSGQK